LVRNKKARENGKSGFRKAGNENNNFIKISLSSNL